MKAVRFSTIVLAALLAAGIGAKSYAFHSGGVAECEGCHSMHSPAAGGSFLLVGATQSEACLTCHENPADTGPSSYHISTVSSAINPTSAPKQRTPGGDFGWVKLDFTYSTTSSSGVVTNYREVGDGHGHNIIAPANGYNTDATNATAPGGTFPSANLQCNSCHDPHGQYRRLPSGLIAKTGAPIWASGSYLGTSVALNEPKASGEAVGVYRLLAGAGYTKGGVTFNGVPAAKVPSTFNQTEATNQVRVAYGKATTGGHESWGDWCSTCHPAMHSAPAGGGSSYVHPVDHDLGSTISANYQAYVKSGDMTGTGGNGFNSLVPFITNSAEYAGVLAPLAVNNNTKLAGPDTTDQVSCLSCHRAHASGFEHMLRWDYGYEFMTKGGQYIGSDNPEVGTTGRGPLQSRGRNNAMWQSAYYDRLPGQFATYQRVMCNKCHAKD